MTRNHLSSHQVHIEAELLQHSPQEGGVLVAHAPYAACHQLVQQGGCVQPRVHALAGVNWDRVKRNCLDVRPVDGVEAIAAGSAEGRPVQADCAQVGVSVHLRQTSTAHVFSLDIRCNLEICGRK